MIVHLSFVAFIHAISSKPYKPIRHGALGQVKTDT